MTHPLMSIMKEIRAKDRTIYRWTEQYNFYLECVFRTMEVLQQCTDFASERIINEYTEKLKKQQQYCREFDEKISERIQILLDKRSKSKK